MVTSTMRAEVPEVVAESASSEAEESWDEDEDYDGDDGHEGFALDRSLHAACRQAGGGGNRAEDHTTAKQQAQMQRLQARVNFDVMPQSRSGMSHACKNSIVQSEKKAATSRNLGLTQDTRATVEQVLDPRTMLVLGKFLKRGLISEIQGCISTGKEANVYYAKAEEGKERAVKVYKTSILVFKDRARYVEGEYRFRNGYCKGNPRKMVSQWAEKEMRNLRRIKAAGIMCPEVYEVRQNVLVMDFLGVDGDAAPRLKDAPGIDAEEWSSLYVQCVLTMRRLMQECKLVHGDLSEYNMLYLDGDLYIIDVSQSVESDHPQSLDFLKRDCVNVNNFFGKCMAGAALGLKKLFDFVVTKELDVVAAGDPVLRRELDEVALRKLLDEAAEADEDPEDEVFLQTWIPSHLDQVNDRAFIERDIARRAGGEELLYDRLLADDANEEPRPESSADEADAGEEEKALDTATPRTPDAGAEDTATSRAPDAGAETGSEEDSDGEANDGHIPEGVDKKQWKAQVKAEKAEKRKDKCPKALKKKYRKQAAKGR